MLTNRTCFVIDDDPDDQEIFALALKKIDPMMECYFASDGIEALEKLSDDGFVPQYIFIDLNMPRMDGRQCLVEIKKLHHLTDTPLVIYSTSSNNNFKVELKNLGATDYIVKPTKISILIQDLSNFFRSNKTG